MERDIRVKIKMLKALGYIKSYRELGDILEMSPKSFYNYLRGEYELGSYRREALECIVNDLWCDEMR